MKKSTRIIILFCVLCQLVGSFASCKKKPTDEKPIEEVAFELTMEQLSAYTIVVPSKSTEDMNSVANTLNSAIQNATGATLQIKRDYVEEGSDTFRESEYEILIGYTDRKEARNFYQDVKENDTGYALVGKKLLILGYTRNAADKSVLQFKIDVLNKGTDSGVLLVSGDNKITAGSYKYEKLLVNGVNISNYKIIYPQLPSKGEGEIATYLQDWIAYKTGYIINCANDTTATGEYEIQIGTTSRVTDAMVSARNAKGFNDNMTYIGMNGNTLWLSGNSRLALYTAFTKFITLAAPSEKNIAININASESYPINQAKVSVMNYNIYYDLNESKRNPDDVIVSIKQRNADVFGLLESGADWIAKLKPEIEDKYVCVLGKSIDGTKNTSYNPIYYKPDKFDLIESGTKWLSDTPNVLSKYLTAKHYQALTYVILKDKTTGAEFMYVNVHFDGSNDSAAHSALVEVRKKQAVVLKNFVAEYSFLPIIVGGDFNENPTHSTITSVSTNSRLISCAKVAETKIIVPSDVNSEFNAIASASPDYLFVTTDCIKVQKFEVWDNKINGKYPSDHLPVCAELTIHF